MKNFPLDLVYADPSRNKTERQILLVEPSYHNKYPPLGLMKISAYHRQLGDTVIFFKGQYKDYFFDEKVAGCLAKIKLQRFDLEDWQLFEMLVREYLKYRHQEKLQAILQLIPNGNIHTVKHILSTYLTKESFRKFDRVYVTTLFTFYWKQTIEAIEFAKKVAKTPESVYVGGVAASVIPELFAQETGLVVGKNIIVGLLDKPRMLDDNDIIIDEITPDYSLLETIDYHYRLDTGYLTYMTKGCTRECAFCAVPKLEPSYKEKVSVKKQIQQISEKYGERKNLILMDNNVLGSPKLTEIVQEILEMGFTKNAKFVEPNRFILLINYLRESHDDYTQKKLLGKLFNLLKNFGNTRIKSDKIREQYYQLLRERGLDSFFSFTKEAILDSVDEINKFIEKHRSKAKSNRYVDFNQGLDCRYLDEEKIKLLSQLPIRPMRISFDFLKFRDEYENAVRLADKYSIPELSNYMLYNYKDKPEELWQRLQINNQLNKELETAIYSFPMKYIPCFGEESKNRSFVGTHWNSKYLRAIQIILNVTKGVGAVTPSFAERAFGKTLDEFFKILIMPESYIRYRNHFEKTGDTDKWFYQWENLSQNEREQVKTYIYSQKFSNFNGSTSKAMTEFMKHYQDDYSPRSVYFLPQLMVEKK